MHSQILYDLYAPTCIYVYTYIPISISKFPTNPFCQKLQGTHPTKKTIFLPSTKYIHIYIQNIYLMNLTKIYIDIFFDSFFKELQEEEFALEEDVNIESSTVLQGLLEQGNELIFDRFGIKPSEKKYFIGGSAALYLYPSLRTQLGAVSTIGDLDVVIPGEENWKILLANKTAPNVELGEKEKAEGKFKVTDEALFESNYNAGIYRPEEVKKKEIEAFKEWRPDLAPKDKGDIVQNVDVRSTATILQKAIFKDGYWYMSLRDIIDYKLKLGRKKEKDIADIIAKYKAGEFGDKKDFLKKLLQQYRSDDPGVKGLP